MTRTFSMIGRLGFAAFFAFSICIFSLPAGAQTTHDSKESAERASGQGIIFKAPDKFMRAPLSGFKGMLMLNPDAPSAIVISYPNEGETIDDLTKRILVAVPRFFGGSKDTEFEWTSSPIAVHGGDVQGSGSMHRAVRGDTELQLALYQREWKGLTLAYGYFAMKKTDEKEKEYKKYWMSNDGAGVKPFEAFWKSFPK